MKWTEEKKRLLLNCKNDDELRRAFPGYCITTLARYKRRFRQKKMPRKMETSVLLPDIHHPYHDRSCWNAIKKFLKYFQPNRVVLMGDAIEMRAIDHWKQEHGNLRYFEGQRLLFDYQEFIKDILKPIDNICPNSEKIYLGGNHEDWAYRLIDKIPQLEGLIEPEIGMDLKKRGWKWIPYIYKDEAGNIRPGKIKIGKLTITHGQYTNKYHAAKNAQIYDKSVVTGHSHDLQIYTKVHEEDPGDYHTAQSIGCLCNKSPYFMRGKPNRWVHAFGILYTRKDGLYNLYIHIIMGGQFIYAGKSFKGGRYD